MDRKVIKKVAEQTGLPERIVDRTYNAYWKVIREHMSSMPLKDDLSDEEFNALRPNVNIPSLGKFYITLERYRYLRREFNKNDKDIEEDDSY